MLARPRIEARERELERLRAERFPTLPLDCGERVAPGVVDVEEWRDWSRRDTTPDQVRIEDYLDQFDLRDRSILHVGIGNSGLARRFASRARLICGTTIMPAEVEQAGRLGLRNYRVSAHNKYRGSDDAPDGRFDFIVDNSMTGFCCCLTHLAAMLDFYSSSLAPSGQIVTDRVGLAWAVDPQRPEWGFTFDDLAAVAPVAGLRAYRIDSNIYVLARQAPERRPLSRRISHWARSIARKVKRRLSRLLRAR